MDIQLEIGSIHKAHGLNGEVIVSLVSNAPERLQVGSKYWLNSTQHQVENPQTQDKHDHLIVKNSKAHQGRFIVAFEGITSREQAESLRGKKLTAPPLAKSEVGDLWVHELVGCEVIDQNGNNHGKVCALQANPASDLLVLDSEALIPVSFIVSHESGSINVDVPEGLLK